jgi:hypothetical protein
VDRPLRRAMITIGGFAAILNIEQGAERLMHSLAEEFRERLHRFNMGEENLESGQDRNS